MSVDTGDFDTLVDIVGGTAGVSDRVSGFSGAHGGFLAAVSLRALGAELTRTRPARALTLHLSAPVRSGELALDPVIDREGGSLSSGSLRIFQNGRTAAVAIALFGEGAAGPDRVDVAMPAVPLPSECRPLIDKPVPDATAGLLVEHRPAGPPMPLSGSDEACLLVWMRLLGDRALDAASLAFLADSAPPALFGALTEFLAMPSIEIAIQFAPEAVEPDDRWVLCVTRSRAAAHGYATEDIELWSVDGRLLVTAQQLRRVLPPR